MVAGTAAPFSPAIWPASTWTATPGRALPWKPPMGSLGVGWCVTPSAISTSGFTLAPMKQSCTTRISSSMAENCRHKSHQHSAWGADVIRLMMRAQHLGHSSPPLLVLHKAQRSKPVSRNRAITRGWRRNSEHCTCSPPESQMPAPTVCFCSTPIVGAEHLSPAPACIR